MPQCTFRLISGQTIRLDVEGSITVDQLRERMLPVYRELVDVPLHEMKLMFVKEEAQKGLFGRQTVKVELGNGRRSLHDYGVGRSAGQRALIVVLPTVKQWGLRMLIAIKLDDVGRCTQAASWHPSATHWAVRREVRTIEIPVPDDFDEELTPLPDPEVVSYLTYGDFEAAGEDLPPLPDDFGRLQGGWVEGDTALHLAVRNRAEQVCRFLVESGAPLSAKNINGFTPLDEARKLRDNATFTALLDRPRNDLMWQVAPRRGNTTPRVPAAAAASSSSSPASPARRTAVAAASRGRAGGSSSGGSPAGSSGSSTPKPKRPAPGSTPSPAALAAARAARGISSDEEDEDEDEDEEDNGGPARLSSNPPAPVRRTNNNPPAPVRRTNNSVATPPSAKKQQEEEEGEEG
jgi:hypothetical protein